MLSTDRRGSSVQNESKHAMNRRHFTTVLLFSLSRIFKLIMNKIYPIYVVFELILIGRTSPIHRYHYYEDKVKKWKIVILLIVRFIVSNECGATLNCSKTTISTSCTISSSLTSALFILFSCQDPWNLRLESSSLRQFLEQKCYPLRDHFNANLRFT